MVLSRQVGTPATVSFLRKGARSVVVTYSVQFSATVGKLRGEMSAELEERPVDADTARFTVRNIRVRQGAEEWKPWSDTRERSWSAPFLSAQTVLGIDAETGRIGSTIEIPSDGIEILDTRLPIESVIPMGGSLNVAGLVGQRVTLRGRLALMLLGSKRDCEVEAQFDPYSGRPVRLSLQTVSNAGGLEPQVTLTVRAAGTGEG